MTAIRMAPSLNWEGNDGPWSSFALQIGIPAQVITVLPATSQSNIWAVLPDFCPGLTAVGDCASFRGGLYNPENSTTYVKIETDDLYVQLSFESEEVLGYNGTAEVGTDLVGLGLPDTGGQVLQEQVITAFAYTDPWLAVGLLGLNNESLPVVNATDLHLSPLSTLRENGTIASSFWAYNAGARYLDPMAHASLTLGGYDTVRGGDLEDALTIPMRQESARDLVVSVEAITIGEGESYRLDPAINAFIDSVVPDIWLPEEACRRFEEAFDLEWNETAQMYLLDEEHRNRLYGTDAKVVFTLADPADPTKSIDISFAYAGFDLTARYPLAGIQDDSALQYFPLKRANVSSQYFLGHAFLQEAYLSADYDRSEFHISQANLSEGAMSYNIKTVHPPGRGGLSPGAITGIAVGVAIIALIAAGLAGWYLCRPKWKKRRNARFLARIEAENAGLPATQMAGGPGTEMQEYYAKPPLRAEELDAATTARGSIASRAELESPSQSSVGSPGRKTASRRTSYGFPASPAELESRSPRMMHSRTASGSSIEPMSPLSGVARSELARTDEVHELP